VAIGMIVLGHVLYNKAKKGDEVSDIHYWGYGLLAVMLLIVSIMHLCTVNNAINLEAQYYTYYTYSQDVKDNVLIIDLNQLEGKLISENSENVSDTVSIGRLRVDVFNYNQNLYSVRHWATDPFVGLFIESPNNDLKPIILR
jgi:hypothetical protein